MTSNVMFRRSSLVLAYAGALVLLTPDSAWADDLYRGQSFAAMASDRVAAAVGDSLTIVVIQAAEARNSAAASSSAGYNLDASLDAGSTSEGLSLNFDRSGDRRGEVRRSQSFTTQLAVTVLEVKANGDLVVAGEQRMLVNGQATTLRVSGRVRPSDIQSDNRVPSNRVVDAKIEFDSVDRINARQRRSVLAWLGNWFRGIF